ncbi:MAG: threonine ammonia-lyase [Clostridiaceae bacterium]
MELTNKNELDLGNELLKIREAEENLKGIIKETKLIESTVFSDEYNNEVYIKPENLQVTGAFKIRGAYNKISKLSEEEKRKGVIASSAGNHSQGVAYAAKLLGVSATIVMPKNTPLIKVESTRGYGAKVVLHGGCYDEAYAEAKRLQEENGYLFIHPFDDLEVIEGQGTIGYEILKEIEDMDYILVPVGGGGLISGIALAAKALNKNVKVIGVEPVGAMAMKKSMDKGGVVILNHVNTIAEGVAVKKPGNLPYQIIKSYVDDIVTVTDFDIMEASLLLIEKHKLVAESAGALSLAGLKKLDVSNKKIACVLSGGNIDVLTMSSLINRGLVSRGRLFCFSVELPDIPGELLKISEILSGLNANVVKLDHNQFKTFDRFNQVLLEITLETNGHEHVEKIIESLGKNGYEIATVAGY